MEFTEEQKKELISRWEASGFLEGITGLLNNPKIEALFKSDEKWTIERYSNKEDENEEIIDTKL